MSLVEYETDANLAIVTINRPEARNAVDRPTAAELVAAFRRFDADPNLNVAILTGNGPLGCTRMLLSKPVIAAVEGFAVAGGLELALWCDMRVAARDAVFGVFCRRWGVPLVDGGTVRLPRLIGMSHAMDMILTGRGVSGDEALRMGLANRLTEKGEALAGARELAGRIAAFPQRCVRSDRMSAYEAWTMPLGDALANEYRHGIATINSGETREGAQRFAAGAGRHGKF